jgi:hypothetical protein
MPDQVRHDRYKFIAFVNFDTVSQAGIQALLNWTPAFAAVTIIL